MQARPATHPAISHAAVGVLAAVLLAASPAAAQYASPEPVARSTAAPPWWVVPVMGGGGALVGFGAGASIGLITYGNTCESCWGGGDAWLTGGLIGAGIGAGVGLITSTIIVVASRPSRAAQAAPVIALSPEHTYAGLRMIF